MKKFHGKDVDFAIKLLNSFSKRKKAIKLFNIAFAIFSVSVFIYLLFHFEFDLGKTITIYVVYLIIFTAVYLALRGKVIHFASSFERTYHAKILGGYMFGNLDTVNYEISLEDFLNLTEYDFIQLGVKSDYNTDYLDAKVIAEKEILNVKHKYKKFIF